MGEHLVIDIPGIGALPAYFSPAAMRDEEGRAPGVVVVHEAFGLTDDIRGIADEFAARGYDAIAPDLLSYGGKTRCMVAVFRALQAEKGRPFTEISAARGWLTARADANGKVGIAGFCLGGAFAILMAARGLDGTLKGAAARLDAALAVAGVEHDVKEYPDAGHSFMNHSSAPGWMKPFTGSMHAGYVDTAAADTWDRIDAMFTSALRD